MRPDPAGPRSRVPSGDSHAQAVASEGAPLEYPVMLSGAYPTTQNKAKRRKQSDTLACYFVAERKPNSDLADLVMFSSRTFFHLAKM